MPRRYGLIVAAEVGAGGDAVAHAVPSLGTLTPRHGITLCGFPVEYLAVVPDMAWDQVVEASRCRLCEAD